MAALRPHLSLVILSVLLTVIVLIAWGAGGTLIMRTVTEALILVVVVVGLFIFIGNSGILSFGHISFMAIGAYAAAWQTVPVNFKKLTMPGLPSFLLNTVYPLVPASILAGLLAALFAFVTGLAIMRLSGVAASIATLALLGAINIGYSNWDSVTLGTSSIVGLPPYVDVWVALVWALAAMTAASLHRHSRYGLALRASREDEAASKAAGVNVFRQRLISWVLSAFFVGVGGVLYGHFLGTITVDAFYLGMTFITLAMLVVGGMNSLSGAVLGVIVISTLVELLRQVEKGVSIGSVEFAAPPGLQEIGLALVMLVILIFRPSGLTGNRELTELMPRAVGGALRRGGRTRFQSIDDITTRTRPR